MKKLKLIPVLALVFMLNVASMCSNDDNSNPSTPTPISTIITSGAWRVTLYNENGSIHTSDFTGYNFTMNANGALTAVKDSATKTGTWSTFVDSGATKFAIAFPDTDGPFESITDDWLVLTSAASKIELKHVSGGDGSIDLLTFEKN